MSNNQKRVIYQPPAPKEIQKFARVACQQLAEKDAAYNNPEVVSGFADFLTYVSQLTAKYLSEGHDDLLDNSR